MHDGDFTTAVQELKKMGPSQLIGQLQKIFHDITQFSPDQAIAAHQTLSLLDELFDQDQKEGRIIVQRAKEAIEIQMRHLATTEARALPDDSLLFYLPLKHRFEQAIGKRLGSLFQ